jgi:caffeoyl-CoA O-methyltransferase
VSLTLLPAELDGYLLRHVRRSAVLKEMERLAERRRYDVGGGRSIAFPIIGPLVGNLLAQQARLVRARRVFELGSGYGYSAVWFAQAVGPGGKVICTDRDEANRDLALRFLRRAGLASRVEFRVGDGLALLKKERRSSQDLVFIDMDKAQYPDAYRAAIPALRAGGLLTADNVLWSGEVLRPSRDRSTRALQQFTRLVTSNPRLRTVIHPIRDGVSVSLKLT